jgi:acetyl/propionyl-CoA carboxylase alpha subunit
MTGRELHWASHEQEIVVRIEETGGKGSLHIADKSYDFVVHDRQSEGGWLEIQGKNHRFYLHRNREEIAVWIDGRTYRLTRLQKGQVADHAVVAGGEVRALMPGKVLRVEVAVGDVVAERQPVVTMESMKMESALAAPRAGTVIAVQCQVGQIVDMGEVLVIIE